MSLLFFKKSPACVRQSSAVAQRPSNVPPYSPDLNPIEQAFAKLKAGLRKIDSRTVAGLWDAVGDQLDCFTPQGCVNYLTNARYVPLVRDTL